MFDIFILFFKSIKVLVCFKRVNMINWRIWMVYNGQEGRV